METATTGSTVSRGRTVPAENEPVSVSPPRAATVSKRPQPAARGHGVEAAPALPAHLPVGVRQAGTGCGRGDVAARAQGRCGPALAPVVADLAVGVDGARTAAGARPVHVGLGG